MSPWQAVGFHMTNQRFYRLATFDVAFILRIHALSLCQRARPGLIFAVPTIAAVHIGLFNARTCRSTHLGQGLVQGVFVKRIAWNCHRVNDKIAGIRYHHTDFDECATHTSALVEAHIIRSFLARLALRQHDVIGLLQHPQETSSYNGKSALG